MTIWTKSLNQSRPLQLLDDCKYNNERLTARKMIKKEKDKNHNKNRATSKLGSLYHKNLRSFYHLSFKTFLHHLRKPIKNEWKKKLIQKAGIICNRRKEKNTEKYKKVNTNSS